MPRLAWILVVLALCIGAFLQPAILIPLGVPGGLLLYALRDFVPADVLYSSYSGVDFALGVVVLCSAMFWMMLTFVIRWQSGGRLISFLMRLPAKRIGLIAATINVLVFITMLATRDADYGRLAETEACFRSETSECFGSPLLSPIYGSGGRLPLGAKVKLGWPFAQLLS